uniref:Kinesin motor domain-containing protein n=1 Tax=Timema poppense TaxID=170557 RepID=A0A7R9DKD5_TIMPO|nr:unnamed protein product [Timema poppensis]
MIPPPSLTDTDESPGVYLRDDPLFGTQLQNHSELRAPSAEKAAFYLDAAVAARGGTTGREEVKDGHFLYTLHVYQYSMAGKGGVAGGRSRLHLMDLGSCEKGKAGGGIPLSGLGNVLLAIFNGQKHLPYREHKITHVLKECLSSLTCHAAMIAHVSPQAQHYTDTLATIQLASRIHRMRRRKIKFAGTSTGSGGSSGEETRLQTKENGHSTGSSDVDPSSSEQSADTVIYVGRSDEATDGEHPPVYIPSLNSGDNRCAMGKALRGSGVEHKSSLLSSPAKQVHRIPNGHNAGYGYMDSHKKTMIKKWVENQTSQIQRHSGTRQEPRPPVTGAPQAASKELTSFKTSDEETLNPQTDKEPNSDLFRTTSEVVSNSVGELKMEAREIEKTCTEVKEETNPRHDLTKEDVIDLESSINKQRVNDQVRGECEGSHGKLLENENKDDAQVPSKPTQPFNKEISIDVSMDSFDVRLRISEDSRQPISQKTDNNSNMKDLDVRNEENDNEQDEEEADENYVDDEEEIDYLDDMEIIEVEEPSEPVPMQDCCLQVTEEDIALCMAQMENPLSEVGHESAENHPLRILSQENLTVVSTFTDSMSVATDMDRTLPRRQFSHSSLPDHPLHTPRPYSLHELQEHYNNLWLLDGNSTDCETKRRHNGMVDYQDLNASRSKFDQLSRLHEMYKTKLARANSTRFLDPIQQLKYHRPSRCQSLSLNDMLYGDDCDTHDKTDLNYSGCNGGTSIYSEPAYVFKQQVQSETKICDNCRNNLKPNGTTTNMWHRPFLTGSRDHIFGPTKGIHTSYCGRNGHRFCTRLSNNISSLRHPDGASNPDLKEETKRVPGNGASTSDHEGDLKDRRRRESCEEVRTVTGKENDDEEDDEPPPTLPPPLAAQVASRLHARLFSRSSAHLKPSCLEGYDSADSSSPRPTKSRQSLPGKLGLQRSAQCESSGYESFLRDSECSSLASSQDSDTGSTRSAGKLRGDNRTDSSRVHVYDLLVSIVPVLQYCREDVERLERRWSEARGGRIKELKDTQQQLKKELAATKRRLLIPSSRWSFELHVEASMDPRNPGFLEALERETQILRKRVEACKSRVLIVTCFDTLVNSHQ